MKKSDKKIEKLLRESLTEVCDNALESVAGFEWITHTVDYARVSNSLIIVAVFKDERTLAQAKTSREDQYLQSLIREKLGQVGITLNKPDKQIFLDSEQACETHCAGDWNLRLKRY